jgi:hypothetical protein
MKKISVGFAKRDISPKEPVPGRLGLNHMIHPYHPISAKAAAFENSEGRYLFIVCEIVGLTKSVIKKIRNRIVTATGMKYNNIVITGTHTHASPWIWDLQDAQARKYGLEVLDREWMDSLISNTADAGIEALSKIGEYSIKYGISSTKGIVSNRVSPVTRWSICKDDEIRNAPEGTVDNKVRTISFHDSEDKPVFIFANLACHPSAYGGGKTTKVSPDFPYFAEKKVAAYFSKDTVTAYWQGCAGNINSGKYVKEGSDEEVEKIGNSFGDSIINAIENSKPMGEGQFIFKHLKFSLTVGDFVLNPKRNQVNFEKVSMEIKEKGVFSDEEVFNWRKILKQYDVSLLSKGKEMEIEFQLLRFYDTDILFVPGEWFVEMYTNLSNRNKDRRLIVTTLNNFDLLYVPDEASMSNKEWYGVRTDMRSLGNRSAIELYNRAVEFLD